MPNSVLKIYNKTTGKKVTLATDGAPIVEDREFILPNTSGTLVTKTETEAIVEEALVAYSESNPNSEGVDQTAVLNMFANAATKSTILDTDKFTMIEAGIGENASPAIKNIPYSDFKIELKTYFDTLYTGDTGGGSGTVTGSSVAPELTGPNTASETQTVVINIANYDVSSIYTVEITGGTFSRVGGVITWILPQVIDSSAHKLTVSVINPGKTVTSVFHAINVFNINTTVDSVVLYEGATITEFSKLNNIGITSSKLVAAADTTLVISNNKINVTSAMEQGDKLLVDGAVYELTGTIMATDGTTNGSLVNAVSKATSNTTPEGTIICDSEVTNPAYLAFDRVNGAGWRTTKATGLWIGFRFNTPRVINKYRVAGYNVAATVAPKNWIFQASNDGEQWIDLGAVTNQTTWVSSELRTFTCVNDTPYNYYRIYITAGNGSADIGLASLEFIETVNIVSSTLPVLPQFISNAKLLTKYAESNTITQDSYETDFSGVNGLTATYEQYNLVTLLTTAIAVPTLLVNVGDIVVLGNSTDGVKSITVSTENYIANVLDISTLGFSVVPTYGYRKDAQLQVTIGSTTFTATDRVDTILTSPVYDADGAINASITNKVPVLTGPTNVKSSAMYADGYEAWRAFDGLSNDAAATCLFYGNINPWISYDFTAPVVINKYAVAAKTEWDTPHVWSLLGSNDETTWVTLDTRSGITWTGTATTKWFTFNNGNAYRYYKLQITASSAHLGIKELVLVEGVIPKMTIRAVYGDILSGYSARTVKFRAKLNKIGDAISKLTATLQKL